MKSQLHSEIAGAINKCSAENASDTPDFILAQYLVRCLEAWDEATNARERWYGRTIHEPASTPLDTPPLNSTPRYARVGYRYYSVITPQVALEYELPTDEGDEPGEDLNVVERAHLEELIDTAAAHNTSIKSSTYALL